VVTNVEWGREDNGEGEGEPQDINGMKIGGSKEGKLMEEARPRRRKAELTGWMDDEGRRWREASHRIT
jgi:hypothetical protein